MPTSAQFATVPAAGQFDHQETALIADLAQAITLWKLHTTTPEDKVKADYDAAIKTLRDIAQGVIRIPDAAGVDATPSGAQGVQFIDRERPFTPENMTGFI